jgi:hypothetical protein
MYWEHGNIKKGNNLMQHCFSSDNETDDDACPCKEEIEKRSKGSCWFLMFLFRI